MSLPNGEVKRVPVPRCTLYGCYICYSIGRPNRFLAGVILNEALESITVLFE